MSAPKSGYFRGAGGTVWEMDLPLKELYGHQLSKGELVRVNSDGSPWTGGTTPVQGGEEVAVDPRDLEIARLRAELEAAQAPKHGPVNPEAVPDGSVPDVLTWVGEDKARAERALQAEWAKGEAQRKGVVDPLAKLLGLEQ
jgi:hypothetical protein